MPDTYAAPMYWPAFWLFGGTSYDPQGFATELDGFEFCGNHMSDIKTSRHRYYDNERHSETASSGMGFSSSGGFHTYTLEWDYYWVRWYVDGSLVRAAPGIITASGTTISGCDPLGAGTYWWHPLHPNNDAYLPLLISTGMSNNSQLTPDPNDDSFCQSNSDNDPLSFPHDMEVDYVRVWQRDNNLFLPALYSGITTDLVGPEVVCFGSPTTYTVEGHYGHIAWEVGPGLTLLHKSDNSIAVMANSGFNDMSYVQAVSSNAAESWGNGAFTKDVWVGKPRITTASVDVAPCGTDVTMVCHIEPSDGWGGDHRYWFDGQQITTQEYNGVTYPVEPWHAMVHTNTGGATDFCAVYRMESSNQCGTDYSVGVKRDDCVIGPCDIINLNHTELAPFFELSPNPVGGGGVFTVKVLEPLERGVVSRIVVRDANNVMRLQQEAPERETVVSVNGWPSGAYGVYIELLDGRVVVRYEIRL